MRRGWAEDICTDGEAGVPGQTELVRLIWNVIALRTGKPLDRLSIGGVRISLVDEIARASRQANTGKDPNMGQVISFPTATPGQAHPIMHVQATLASMAE